VERIIDLFPTHERHLAQTRLASLLLGILCQSLVPRIDDAGRTAAVEVMIASPAVKNIIRDGKIHQLPNAIMTQISSGMMLLDHALINLHRAGLISGDSLFASCNDREEVAKLMGTIEVE
jgi:twitching motility protein PilT